MERLLTTEEVADLLRIDVVTVRRLVARGELVAYRIANEYRFSGEDVESYVKSQRIEPGPKDPLARFTERARKVLTLSNEEAVAYRHEQVGPEHILLALVREGDGVAAKVLQERAVTMEPLRAFIEERHPVSEYVGEPGRPRGMTEQGKRSIELAVEEAQGLGHKYIGTEHMLLGILRDPDTLGGQALHSFGLAIEEAREDIKRVLEETGKPSVMSTVRKVLSRRPGNLQIQPEADGETRKAEE